ncbi:MAG: hypothetical protein COU09_00370 [Candidatus Harrisonbacteria bacterium CG10_big_fil_rev_8_21_14_0_10_44_23]|uniref:Uncharacterized protein n=1 Tax=Candidatus Harrisonbacteria bacterium CG10_big_fil_rev_8_21_14_0_10_44_23 TaxID=1974585 RepID=A0A2H0UQX4_9BACT|nr:MAG: hypothetical protein COU09_00370 [Candidatus Harrisonbacteria bacterium CG10_big_fil_rev_8_21_14_0_10_44_23]
MKTQVAIATQDQKRRVAEATGISLAMEKIQASLTDQYLQYLAIEAQKMMAGSPNNTVVYIPVGEMGVPLVGTMSATAGK